jgi:hypothetical protein
MSEIKIEKTIDSDGNVHVVKKTHIGGAVKGGITFGTCLAMIISYTAWKSIGWAIVHGLLSWVYVIYYLIKYV